MAIRRRKEHVFTTKQCVLWVFIKYFAAIITLRGGEKHVIKALRYKSEVQRISFQLEIQSLPDRTRPKPGNPKLRGGVYFTPSPRTTQAHQETFKLRYVRVPRPIRKGPRLH